MATFRSRNVSTSVVPAAAAEIWALVTDPAVLAELTPLVQSIDANGDRWRWQLAGISALGVSVAPAFTERMEFEPMRAMRFTHQPGGRREMAGAEGTYELESLAPRSTKLSVDLTLSVELPLPRLAAGAVERVMAATMRSTGHKFAQRLYRRLRLDPSTVAITESHG